MATRPESKLVFYDSGTACFECGERITELPPMLPEVHDDFDWRVRDFDGYLKFMLDELAARFPCLLYTSPSPRDATLSRMPSSA